MKNKSLTKGIISVLIANLINLIFNLLTNFLLPKYLSIDTYAGIKTFQLYCSYIGLLHLGYIDGMFLKYGGKDLLEIKKQDLSVNLSTLRIFQLLVTIPVFIIGALLKDVVTISFACSIVPLNMASYFKFLYQSVGEFERYGKVMNLVTGATFAINFFLLFVLKTDSLPMYLTAYLIVNLTIWIILEIQIQEVADISINCGKFSIRELHSSIKGGILLMVGNFTSTLLSSMDRWFVKLLLNVTDFAQYSFAVSVESVINVAVTPISVTLYNYFCKHENDIAVIKKSKSYVTLFTTLVVAAVFPAKLIIELFLTDYLGAMSVAFYLFAAQIIYIIIQAIYVNLYKAKHKQNKYFSKLCMVIVSGILLNIVCFWVWKTKEAFAFGTMLSAMVWLILSEYDFKEIRYSLIEYLYLAIEIVVFLICGLHMNAVIGLIIYFAVTICMDFVIYKNSIRDIFYLTTSCLKKRRIVQGEK